jgi:hypothetical protein
MYAMNHAKSVAAMADYLETWPEIRARHKREKIELLQSLCNHYTVDVAARILDTKQTTIRRYAIDHGVKFIRKIRNGRYNYQAPHEVTVSCKDT